MEVIRLVKGYRRQQGMMYLFNGMSSVSLSGYLVFNLFNICSYLLKMVAYCTFSKTVFRKGNFISPRVWIGTEKEELLHTFHGLVWLVSRPCWSKINCIMLQWCFPPTGTSELTAIVIKLTLYRIGNRGQYKLFGQQCSDIKLWQVLEQ